jgi:hypothetical protein
MTDNGHQVMAKAHIAFGKVCLNRNLVGSIYGMFSMKIAHFVPIGQQTWPPHAILVSDWSISKKSMLPTKFQFIWLRVFRGEN